MSDSGTGGPGRGSSARPSRRRAPRRRALVALLLAAAPAVAASRSAASPSPAIGILVTDLPCSDLAAVRSLGPADWRPFPLAPGREARRGASLWLRLAAADPAGGAWTIAMPSNRALALTWFAPPAYAPERLDASDPRAWQLSFRHLGREVRPSAGGETLLCFAGGGLGADELEVAPAEEFRAADLNATQWRAVAFGVILAMSLFSGLFYLALRELVFVKYLGYLLAFLLYLACETGAAHRLPVLSALDVRSMVRVDGMAIDLASGLAILFALEFVNLRRLTPRLARPLRWIGATLFPLAVAHGAAFLTGSDALVAATVAISNVLVGVGGMTLLAAVAIAAGRRDRYARFFLAGWTPLVLTALAASAQQLFGSRTLAATLDAMLVAGAVESVVLAIGLADRTLTYRHELDRARELADRDALSGLLNRRALERLTTALDAESTRRGGVAVAMFDLDHFKRVNDERGHLVGDACIRAFAEHLAAEVRHTDFAARYGGEEFVVVLPGATRDKAVALAERVRLRVAREGALCDGVRVPLTVSAGVAAGQAAAGVEELLERADRALYAAKGAGRDRVAVEGGGEPPRAPG
jgi:diguanylate cyclase (GGDEF)-like protein